MIAAEQVITKGIKMKRILTTNYKECLEFLLDEFGIDRKTNKPCLCNHLSCIDCLFEETRDCDEIFKWIKEHGTEEYINQIVREGSYDLAVFNNRPMYCRNAQEFNLCSSCAFYSENGSCAQHRIDYLLEEV